MIFLTPIFVTFLITHAIVIVTGILSHGQNLQPMVLDTIAETKMGVNEIGIIAMGIIFLRAFCLGGGTFTGIEAVSNGLQILREPRVATGKRTMHYMASSLAFTAGGILIIYLLNRISLVPGQTLNATLVHQIADNWPFGHVFFLVTLLSEGALLLVAAQAGFMDGPRVMSNMAMDNWLPHRFKNLSDRLVIKDGILMVGISALAILLFTGASVRILVVMYSINVFLTFSLSQYGMVRHWLKKKLTADRLKRLMISGTGFVVTAGILIVTSTVKFAEGGWVTLLITGVLIAFCIWVHHHYWLTSKALRHLNEILTDLPLPDNAPVAHKMADKATAVLMVNGYNGIGIHSFLAIHRAYPGYFKNFVFVSVGVIDSDRFKGAAELGNLKASLKKDLDSYINMANKMGFYAEYRMTLETDVTDGLEVLCTEVTKEWPKCVFFAGQLVFETETQWNRFLHNQTCFTIQRKLLFNGLDVVILPIRVRLSKN